MPPPRPLSPLLLGALLPISGWFILRPLTTPLPLAALSASLGFSILAFLSTLFLIPALGPAFVKVGLKGRDLLKKSNEHIPESMGLICASIYILLLIIFIPFPFSSFFVETKNASEGLTQVDFPLAQLSVYLSAILSLLMATLLGFVDDLFDVRWRHKLPIPLIASIPLLLVYYAERGNTHIVVPKPFRSIFGQIMDLGPLYYFYMSLLSTFSTNSINILAGLNALEVSQTLIIALSVCINDALYLPWSRSFTLHIPVPSFLVERIGASWTWTIGGIYGAGLSHGSKELVERHLLSLYFMLPLIGVCLGFMYHNWYPARSFPGDTFCYFSGMAFAVVGIQGHFSKTLLLFFIPQIFNFLLSCPQLFGFVPCPRHRLPRLDSTTSLLTPSTTDFERPPSRLTTTTLKVFSLLRLTRLTIHPTTGQVLSATNFTILNFLLVHVGPVSEQGLVLMMMGIQVACSVAAFVVRHGLAGLVYDGDRR
ncbi:N-acetylglucosaminephosphotransferase [Ramaria rubella]|nr:N-acetylglucosaminephosphotransferase [Ramaria rubella]KAF8587551.1 N-acetylglucosaminephosphotransferase [Ramaria rubella]